MPLDLLFSVASGFATIGWLLLIVLPRWRYTQPIAGGAIPIAIAVLYLVLIVRFFPSAKGGFGSLADVALLFSQPALLLAGWIHYLCVDLFIGSWESRDSQRRGISHWLVVPCLLLTFMLGPIGLLTYLGLRTWRAGLVEL